MKIKSVKRDIYDKTTCYGISILFEDKTTLFITDTILNCIREKARRGEHKKDLFFVGDKTCDFLIHRERT
jgi:hypothetical protein